MGVDISDRFETFISQSANSNLNGRHFAVALASKMWGDRTLRYHKVSLMDRKPKKDAVPRPSLQKKDPEGFSIFKGEWFVAGF
jgi:hypothetical protein